MLSLFSFLSFFLLFFFFFFFFNDTATTEIYTLSLHDALPISGLDCNSSDRLRSSYSHYSSRSEEHTSELQSPKDLVCRLLLEKKKKKKTYQRTASMKNTIMGRRSTLGV